MPPCTSCQSPRRSTCRSPRRCPRSRPGAPPRHRTAPCTPSVRGQGWTDVTAREFNDLVRSVARGLVARGIEVGQPVAILSPTRYEWTVLDFALWTAGAFAVPIYDSSSAEQIEWILQDSDAVAVITDSTKSADRVRGATLSSPPPLWVMDEGLIEALVADGAAVSDEVLTTRCAAVAPQDPATIVYTSGTTGRPKGCVITHENLMFVARTLVAGTGPVVSTPGARTVLFLPLAHVLGRRCPGLQRPGRDAGRPLPGREAPARGHAQLPAHLPGGRPEDLREDLQRLPAEGVRGGQGAHLRPGHGRGHRLRPGHLGRRALPVAEGSARRVRSPGLRQAARRDGRRAALCDHRGGQPRCATGQLLRRDRAHRDGGLRTHGDHRVRDLQPR